MTSSAPSASDPLGIPGYTFADLHDPERLASLYERFCEAVAADDPDGWAAWDAYRQAPDAPRTAQQQSALLVHMAPHVSRFIARLFMVGDDVAALSDETARLDLLFRFKVDLVRRRALPLLKGGAHLSVSSDDEACVRQLMADAREPGDDEELALARAGCALLDREKTDKEGVAPALEAMKRWCASRVHSPAVRGWVTFRVPDTLEPWSLVRVDRPDAAVPERMQGPDDTLRRRDGFALTDTRMTTRQVLGEIHYCVLCHERDKDSCSKGLRESAAAGQPVRIAVNTLGIELQGCPLDEKISEMHALRKAGDAIGALAIVTVDNPMCPGTGHRICNDCMKACIYQKQEPVNIPEAETSALTTVLGLPWGVEIYGLLTRWNPLNVRRPYALPYNGRNVLVVGLGPAGYTLAHYLSNEGFGVVGVDGLKIEPLPAELTGTATTAPRPVRDWQALYQPLDARVQEGFGGVSEYGITVRWDKNFLTLLHLTLARRRGLTMFGGIRFGGTLPIDEAWSYGFHHVAIATGAGRPTIIDLKNNLIRGIRKASDFLMGLQLTGAFRRDTLANMQVRLPAVVIGGGLTAVDTATELMAYYPVQVEKMLTQHEGVVAAHGERDALSAYDEEERAQLEEFLAHGRAIRAERARAAAAGDAPNFVPLLRQWGGVTLAYRKRLVDAPAYRLNHEEVTKALEEGIGIIELTNPVEALADAYGAVRGLVCDVQRTAPNGTTSTVSETLPARAVLVAAGTAPNTVYEKEAPGTFQLDARGRYFQPHRIERGPDGIPRPVADAQGFFTSYTSGGRFVSYYGDNHPRYAGNVVKAMASAKAGYRQVVDLFADEVAANDPAEQPARDAAWRTFVGRLDHEFTARVESVTRLTPTIVEVIVKAPAAARHFEPGQFYRLQNFEAHAPRVQAGARRTPLLMEGLALTGAWVDKAQGLLSMITLEMGVSSRLVAALQPGEPVVVMGPTGAPTEIPEGQRVLLLGGGLGNAVQFSIARALRARGNTVLYFAGYKKGEDLFKREEIEAATDQVIWSTDSGAEILPERPQDAHFRGNIVEAMQAYQRGALGEVLVPLETVDRIIAIGSDRMMAAVRAARHGVLQSYLKPDHVGIGSINSPMQCMLKEVCAQCLQKHVDPATGLETVIFSCVNQDQELDHVDFTNLAARLRQNTVQEKLSNAWFETLLDANPVPRI